MQLFSDHGYAYQNRDASFSKPSRFIYLRINPATPSNDTTWEVAIAALPAVR